MNGACRGADWVYPMGQIYSNQFYAVQVATRFVIALTFTPLPVSLYRVHRPAAHFLHHTYHTVLQLISGQTSVLFFVVAIAVAVVAIKVR